MKSEADRRFEGGEIDGALERYDESLSVDPTFVGSLLNRAACRMAAGRPGECAGDCDAALRVLSPSGADERAAGSAPPPGSRGGNGLVATALCRRGAAKEQLGDLPGAVEDFRSAAKLIEPHDEKSAEDIRRDVRELQKRHAST